MVTLTRFIQGADGGIPPSFDPEQLIFSLLPESLPELHLQINHLLPLFSLHTASVLPFKAQSFNNLSLHLPLLCLSVGNGPVMPD